MNSSNHNDTIEHKDNSIEINNDWIYFSGSLDRSPDKSIQIQNIKSVSLNRDDSNTKRSMINVFGGIILMVVAYSIIVEDARFGFYFVGICFIVFGIIVGRRKDPYSVWVETSKENGYSKRVLFTYDRKYAENIAKKIHSILPVGSRAIKHTTSESYKFWWDKIFDR